MKSYKNYSFILSIFLSLTLIYSGQSFAGDINAKLPDNNDTSSFQIKDSGDNVLLKVQSGGNVGIGTSSPGEKLDVWGRARFNVKSNSSISMSTPGGWAGIIAYSDNGNRRDVIFDDSSIRLLTSSSSSPPPAENGITIRENGRVGINTFSPGAFLEAHSDTTYTFGITSIIRISDNFKSWNLGLGYDGDRFTIASDDNSERLVILKSSGNVGIGTINPGYKLHVNGSAAGTSWTNLSSRVYKEKIQKVDESVYPMMLTKLMKMELTTYKYRKEYGGDGDRKLGFIAEEMPEEVISKDGKGVDIYELLTLTIGAMKAQQKENEILKAKLEEIMARIETLEK